MNPNTLARLIKEVYTAYETGDNSSLPNYETYIFANPRGIGASTEMFGVMFEEDDGSVVIALRGTDSFHDWLNNLDTDLIEFPGMGKVHQGYFDLYTQIINQVRVSPSKNITITGHSLGAAVATLLAAELSKTNDVRLITFASPRVGDNTFADSINWITHYRVINTEDAVPTLPICSSIHHADRWDYCHTGTLKSFTINTGDFKQNHSIDTYIKGVALCCKM